MVVSSTFSTCMLVIWNDKRIGSKWLVNFVKISLFFCLLPENAESNNSSFVFKSILLKGDWNKISESIFPRVSPGGQQEKKMSFTSQHTESVTHKWDEWLFTVNNESSETVYLLSDLAYKVGVGERFGQCTKQYFPSISGKLKRTCQDETRFNLIWTLIGCAEHIVLWQKGKGGKLVLWFSTLNIWRRSQQINFDIHLARNVSPEFFFCWNSSKYEEPSMSRILALLQYKFCKFDKSYLRVFYSICRKDHDSTANPWWWWKELLHPCFCHICTFYTELMLTDGIAFWWYASLCLLEDTHIYVYSVQQILHVSL